MPLPAIALAIGLGAARLAPVIGRATATWLPRLFRSPPPSIAPQIITTGLLAEGLRQSQTRDASPSSLFVGPPRPRGLAQDFVGPPVPSFLPSARQTSASLGISAPKIRPGAVSRPLVLPSVGAISGVASIPNITARTAAVSSSHPLQRVLTRPAYYSGLSAAQLAQIRVPARFPAQTLTQTVPNIISRSIPRALTQSLARTQAVTQSCTCSVSRGGRERKKKKSEWACVKRVPSRYASISTLAKYHVRKAVRRGIRLTKREIKRQVKEYRKQMRKQDR